MKLSDYAKKAGVTYKTAWRWWKAGALKGYQLPSGTIIIEAADSPVVGGDIACIYARVSSYENQDNLQQQAERLTQYAIARGYMIQNVVKEVGSGLDDNRKNLLSILNDNAYTVLVVEHEHRLTRFGANYIKVLFQGQGKRVEIVNQVEDNKEELKTDFEAVITSFCSRIYGIKAKLKAEKLIAELKE